MTASRPWLWGLAIALGCASSAGSSRFTTPRRVVTQPVDVASQNLAPKEQLDALLLGVPELGRATDAIRVAVPPLQVTGASDDAWLGEASSDIVLSELATATGVFGIDRSELGPIMEVLARAPADDAQVIRTAGAVGAHAIVLGTIAAEPQGQLSLALRVAHVGVGEIARGPNVRIPASQLDAELRKQVDALMMRFGVELGSTAKTPPLSLERLEQASRARRLQYQGKLTEAQPLYARALAEPSSAWRFEADYMQLMSDLGLYEWTAERATRVLQRIPSGEAAICDRARISIQKNRHEFPVEDIREAVRMAASCGDPELTAMSLFYFGLGMRHYHHPTSIEALRRARDTLPAGKSSWTRCAIESELYLFEVQSDFDTGGDAEGNYVRIGKACAAAGNMRFASIAHERAAKWAKQPQRELELNVQAIEYATLAGGQQLDHALRASADALRRAGRVSEADERLLQLLGRHLVAITTIYGALPYDEQKLDDDLLARAGVTRPAGTPTEPTGPEAPLARAHRAAVAKALRAWADRTRGQSVKQATWYGSLADDIDGTAPELVDPAKRLETVHKLPLDTILASRTAPLQASGAKVADAFWTLRTWYYASDTEPAQRDTIRTALKKLASWIGSSQAAHHAALVDIDAQLARGETDNALTSIRAAERYSRNHIPAALELLDRQVTAYEKLRDSAHLIETRERMVELAKQSTSSRWVTAIYDAERAKLEANPRAFVEGAARLQRAASELEETQAWEPAADALALAAKLLNNGSRAEGTREATAYHTRRVSLFERTGDPLRLLLARADLLAAISGELQHSFRDRAGAQLKRSTQATAIVTEIAKACAALVDAGRHRDAVRVVATLTASAAGVDVLVDQAMQWAKMFKASAEYPSLMASLHWKRALQATASREKVAQYAASRDAYLVDKDVRNATFMQQEMMRYVSDEAELWAAYDECVEFTSGGEASHGAACVFGVTASILKHTTRSLARRDKLSSVLAHASKLTKEVDKHYPLSWRMSWRYELAIVAALSGDRLAFDSKLGEVEKYYTVTAPDRYQWATALARVGRALKPADPKLAIATLRRFYGAGGASTYWIATQAADDAAFAAGAGDKQAEAEFLAHGRRAVAQQPRYGYLYSRYDADRLFERRDFKRAERGYRETAALVRARAPIEQRLVRELELRAALAAALRRDVKGARAALQEAVDDAKQLDGSASNPTPCYHDQVLQVMSGLEMASRSCAEGSALRALADRMRTSCSVKRCERDDSVFCDDPDAPAFRSTNACGKGFAIEDKR